MWSLKNTQSEVKGSVTLEYDDYTKLKGMACALSDHADQVYASLVTLPQGQWIAEKMFRRLSFRTNKGQEIRSPATVQEISDIAGCLSVDVIKVADAFRDPDCCFLMPPSEVPLTPEKMLDISHESLIRQWKRMANVASETDKTDGWVADEAKLSSTYQDLSRRACKWENQGKYNGPVLTGSDLKEAEEWLAKLGQQLAPWLVRYCRSLNFGKHESKKINAFIAASKEEEKYHSWRSWALGFQALLLPFGIGVSLYMLSGEMSYILKGSVWDCLGVFSLFVIFLVSPVITIIGMHRKINQFMKFIAVFTNGILCISSLALGLYAIFELFRKNNGFGFFALVIFMAFLVFFLSRSLKCLSYQQRRSQ
jgi:hypothetical protein